MQVQDFFAHFQAILENRESVSGEIDCALLQKRTIIITHYSFPGPGRAAKIELLRRYEKSVDFQTKYWYRPKIPIYSADTNISQYRYQYIGRKADIFLPIPIFSCIAQIRGLLAKIGNFQSLNLKNDMFFMRYSNICISQKYRYYISRYRYQQKWLISADTDTDTDIGSTLLIGQILMVDLNWVDLNWVELYQVDINQVLGRS